MKHDAYNKLEFFFVNVVLVVFNVLLSCRWFQKTKIICSSLERMSWIMNDELTILNQNSLIASVSENLTDYFDH